MAPNTATAEKDGVVLRPFCEDDFEPMVRLVATLWHDGCSTASGALTSARQELSYHLSHAGRAMAAVDTADNDRIIGMALVNGEPDDRRWARISEKIWADVTGDDTYGGDVAESHELCAAEAALMAEALAADPSPHEIGQLQLLIVDPAAQGRHVGSRLMRDALDSLAKAGHTRYRLSTDDACNVGFYEHIGLRRVASAPTQVIGEKGLPLNIYVFEGDL